MDFSSDTQLRPAKQVEHIYPMLREDRVENYWLLGLLAVTGMRVGEVLISGRKI